MEVNLRRVNNAVLLEGQNEDGNRVTIDGSLEVGGTGGGFRPMQLLLAAVGGCSAMDVINILKKQRQTLANLSIRVVGERAKEKIPAVFTSIHLHYTLGGSLDRRKVEKALNLAVYKYCSVGEMLQKTAKITFTFDILS